MVIPQLSKPGGIMTDSSGELIVDSGAIEAIAGAYEQASEDLGRIANKFANEYSRASFGDLPSIEQLRRGYLDLAVDSPTSATTRFLEFARTARDFAHHVRASGQTLDTTDVMTAGRLNVSMSRNEAAS